MAAKILLGAGPQTRVYLANKILLNKEVECLQVTNIILASRKRYESVAKITGVPWFVIGILHHMESDNNFEACLHNGQKIIGTGKKTTIAPKGRGPFATWEASAIDVLKTRTCGNTLEGILEFMERYNGLGYRKLGVRSPYLWSSTSAYKKGLFASDLKYNANLVSTRAGCASILKTLEKLGIILVSAK